MFKVPNKHRLRDHPLLGSTDSAGNNGCFIFHYKGYEIKCIASDGAGWEHVSVTIDRKRTPSWEIMCHVKDIFWDEEDCAFQYHPPKSQYVNCHPYCLHLWRPINVEITIPDRILVGI
jgi:hypothetical protein